MTNEEAVAKLKQTYAGMKISRAGDNILTALEIGIEAIQKDIPKVVKRIEIKSGEDSVQHNFFCPTCNVFLEYGKVGRTKIQGGYNERCWACGQLVEWSRRKGAES